MEPITTEITEYSETAAALAALSLKYDGIHFDVTTTKGMAEAKAARSEIKGYRVNLEKKRVEIKAPALKHCQMIDSEAKRITAELVKLEDPIDNTIKAEEARKEKEKQEKAAAEARRISSITLKISQIRSRVSALVGMSAEQMLMLKVHTEGELIDQAVYHEFTDEAEMAKAGTVAQIDKAYRAQVEHEAEQAKIKAEREELAKLRAEQEARDKEAAVKAAAEQKRIDDEHAKLAAEKAKAKKELEEEKQAQVAEINKQRQELEEREKAAQEPKPPTEAPKTGNNYVLINICAHISPEALISAGEAAGLSPEAVDYFRHAEEYPLCLTVAPDGKVIDVAVIYE